MPVILVALLGAVLTTLHDKPATKNSAPIQAPNAQPTPAATPIVRAPEVRRAQLVPVTVKRATLLRLPTQELGVYKYYEMPAVWGGGSVWARYMGTVGRFSEIPRNSIPGDMWNVTETGASWVYCVPIGYDHEVWIDP